jgi:hypothetical protein
MSVAGTRSSTRTGLRRGAGPRERS